MTITNSRTITFAAQLSLWRKQTLLTRLGSFAEAGMVAPAAGILPVQNSIRWPDPMVAMAEEAGISF